MHLQWLRLFVRETVGENPTVHGCTDHFMNHVITSSTHIYATIQRTDETEGPVVTLVGRNYFDSNHQVYVSWPSQAVAQ